MNGKMPIILSSTAKQKAASVVRLQPQADSPSRLDQAIASSQSIILSQQNPLGYWWYTLEANQAINAEYIFLSHTMGLCDHDGESKIAKWIELSQNPDGSWPLYFEGPGDLSATIECYFALKLTGYNPNLDCLTRARHFILQHGGISQCRIFTRIHLALFGIVPWEVCPSMPVEVMHLPPWTPFNIYEFSSWARASIVPLLVIMDQKRVRRLPADFLAELFLEVTIHDCDWSFKSDKNIFSFEQALIKLDKILKLKSRLAIDLGRESALKKCESWIREHLAKTEDIYPALAYGAMALWCMGYPLEDPIIQKALRALRQFQMPLQKTLGSLPEKISSKQTALYQQCCISPVWDTPWAGCALLESGAASHDAQLLQAGRWLISQQILETKGDWSIKNKNILPGGWSFEFANAYFPDVDDTIQVLFFLKQLGLPKEETNLAFQRGLDWFLSMQSANGGWAAFDKNNTLSLVNKIPFSDHGACLDPPTADITGRAVELLATLGYGPHLPHIHKALEFLKRSQEADGSWWGRWGVNYIYGTWCVLQGLKAIGYAPDSRILQKAVDWLKSVQNADGGFGESCESYKQKRYIRLNQSIPSQTAWGLMGLIAGGDGLGDEAKKAAHWLVQHQLKSGTWTENHHTGTGFPGHFYIRYHGYRHYFPLMALAKYKNQQSISN